MKAVRMIKNKRGFSLIELMIVVAIIGILATIAVPNFQKFQNKAKQSEARANLSAMFAAQKSFFAEWGTYYGVFADIGYVPEGKINYLLHTGGAGVAPVGMVAVPATRPGGACISTNGCANLTTPGLIQPTAAHAAINPAGVAAPTAATFLMGAASSLVPGATAVNRDTWTINQNKDLRNAISGI